jgi:hypothetical protein
MSGLVANDVTIYCDLDDVLTNFKESASKAIGISIDKVPTATLWDVLKKKYSFFEALPWSRGERTAPTFWSRL